MALACFIRYPEEFWSHNDIIKPEYFTGVDAFEVAFQLKAYVEKYGKYPSFTTLPNILLQKFERSNPDKATQLVEYTIKLEEVDTSDWESVRDTLVYFAKERAIYAGLKKILAAQKENRTDEVNPIEEMEKALAVGTDTRKAGVFLKRDFKEVIDRATQVTYGTHTGYPLLDAVWKNGWAPGWLIVPLAPPKSYKCQHPDTKILMHDGTIKRICEIKVGDKVMGDDSTPRTVHSCGYGYGPMYKITQANGDDYTVNSDHILCLKRPSGTEPVGRFKNRYHKGSFLEITAEEFSKKPVWFQRTWKGYKVGVEFPSQEFPLDPYFMGLWLGDGTSCEPEVCIGNSDIEIAAYIRNYAQQLDMRVTVEPQKGCSMFRLCNVLNTDSKCSHHGCDRAVVVGKFCGNHYVQAWNRGYRAMPDDQKHSRNNVVAKLESLGVLGNKHVPSIYKINSRSIRLQLLAGLIDSDGHHRKNSGFIFVNTNEQLCTDTCWIARSLGFKSYVRKNRTVCVSKGKKIISHAYGVYIQGNISEIPTRVARKRGKDSVKASDRTTIKIKPVGNGKWFGIEIDGNQKYLHSDFTVTHNTTFCINLALKMIGPASEGDVIYFACEISEELAMMRALHNLSDIGSSDLFEQGIETFKIEAQKGIKKKIGKGELVFKSFASKSATISEMEQHAKYLIAQEGIRPKVIIIDYAETVRPTLSGKNVPDWRQQADIYTQARAMGNKLGCVVIMPDRCNADTVGRKVPSMKSFQGSFEKAGIVDVAIGICFTDQERLQNRVRYFVFLNRHGAQLLHFSGKVDPEKMRMTIDEKIAYTPEEDEEAHKRSGKKGKFSKSLREAMDSDD